MSTPFEPRGQIPSAAARPHDLLTFAFEGPAKFDLNKPLYIDALAPSHSLNALQTKALVRKLVAGLHAVGLQKGDCVAVHLPNSYLYSSLYFGIIGAGGIFAGSNPSYHSHEIDHFLKLTEPKFILTSPDLLQNILEVADAHAILPNHIYTLNAATFPVASLTSAAPSSSDSRVNGVESLDQTDFHLFQYLLQHGEKDWVRIADEETAKATIASYFATSGTSGLPKAAVSSHYALIAQHLAVRCDVSYKVVRLMYLPMFHIFGNLFGHIFPIRYGEPAYVLPRFTLGHFVNAVHDFEISELIVVPPILHALDKSTLPLPDLLKSLRYIICSGAPLDAASQERCYKYLSPDAFLTQAWGMTELGAVTLFRWRDQNIPGSVGLPLPNAEIKLLDSNGEVVTSDSTPGEASVHLPGQITGYRHEPAATSFAIREHGWVRTGDVLMKKDDKYYVVGRAKELIKVRGWQVAPAEIEAILLQHPQIKDVAVARVVLEDGTTEAPKAYVVRRDIEGKEELRAEQVYEYAKERLASFKKLDGGVVFVDSVPRTSSGKTQRFKLPSQDQSQGPGLIS